MSEKFVTLSPDGDVSEWPTGRLKWATTHITGSKVLMQEWAVLIPQTETDKRRKFSVEWREVPDEGE